jgi:hypothetical protein
MWHTWIIHSSSCQKTNALNFYTLLVLMMVLLLPPHGVYKWWLLHGYNLTLYTLRLYQQLIKHWVRVSTENIEWRNIYIYTHTYNNFFKILHFCFPFFILKQLNNKKEKSEVQILNLVTSPFIVITTYVSLIEFSYLKWSQQQITTVESFGLRPNDYTEAKTGLRHRFHYLIIIT